MSKKLDSMWWHEAPKNGPLASSHIAVLFCALVKNNMIVKDLLALEFDGIPKDFSDKSLSPMDYCLAYIDGELFSSYVKAKYREKIVELLEGTKFYNLITDASFMSQVKDSKYDYTLKCTWNNVDILANWLQQNIITGKHPTEATEAHFPLRGKQEPIIMVLGYLSGIAAAAITVYLWKVLPESGIIADTTHTSGEIPPHDLLLGVTITPLAITSIFILLKAKTGNPILRKINSLFILLLGSAVLISCAIISITEKA